MRLPTQDSATGRAAKTAIQAALGFLIGLVIVVWGVPGVPHAVIMYTEQNVTQILLFIGVPAGLVSFGWNLFRKEVPNY